MNKLFVTERLDRAGFQLRVARNDFRITGLLRPSLERLKQMSQQARLVFG